MTNLQALHKVFSSHKEGGWIMKPDSFQALYQFVRTNEVTNALLLGTGIGFSDAVVSLAIEERLRGKKGKKPKCHIHTVEQFKKCFDLAQELIPEELKKNITFHHEEVEIWEHPETSNTPLSIFKKLPEPPKDGWHLIVVDGPGPFINKKGHLVEVPNGDVMKLHHEGKIPAGTIIYFDGRIPALSLIERYYSDDFYLVTAGKRNNFLERKEGKSNFRDERLQAYKGTSYLD